MRDPLEAAKERSAVLRRAAARFPGLDPSAIELHVALGHIAEIANVYAFSSLEEHALSRGRYFIMTHLSIEEMMGNEPPSPSGIAESLGITRATVTQLLDGLERDGLAERRNVGRDRRVQAIHLTEKGRRLFDEITPRTSAAIAKFWKPLNAFERNTLMALLAKLAPRDEPATSP